MNWIFSVEIIDPLIEDTSIEHLIYCYTRLCCYIEKNETFCRNAINASGQNCFVDFLKNYVGRQVSIIGKQCDKDNILKEDDYTFLNDYYYNAFIGILKTWINNGLKEEKELVIKRWNALIFKNIEHYVYAMEKDLDLVTDSFNCVKE